MFLKIIFNYLLDPFLNILYSRIMRALIVNFLKNIFASIIGILTGIFFKNL